MFDEGVLLTSTLRDNLAAALEQVHYHHRRFLIARRGRPMAALVTPGDLRMIEEFHQKSDQQKELERMARMEAWHRAARMSQPISRRTSGS
ncbi:type II toxin-antitoxin system Phd/YefM family antitoxin [Thalassovita sp.]|uniref:type II toxin-antitoxin system Phd/YefM family antitoxin n=1 Tax=Thalassovita sp. TaxID=1979401 RepID=UPI0029DE5BC9|nr:type II toxin-antitoxin system Phd/YefM family antitoxin [Thalassovita sp.]